MSHQPIGVIGHFVRIAAITILALACMFYPFLPGTHDRLAVTLSMMAQALGLTGLPLVLIGLAWLIYEIAKRRRRRSAQPESASPTDKDIYFAIVAVALSSVVALVMAVGATTQIGISLGVGVLILWACIAWKSLRSMWRARRAARDSGSELHAGINPAPLYLIFVPSILTIAQLLFMNKAVELSRVRAIHGSANFINAIESYRDRNGHYPLSLASELSDYDPPIIGIERYHYEPSGKFGVAGGAGGAYNVFFEQFTAFPIGTREFVMYNPRGEQTFMVHDQNILESPQEEVDAERAYHVAHHSEVVPPPAPPNWRRFWFD